MGWLETILAQFGTAGTAIVEWWQQTPKGFKRFIKYGVIPVVIFGAGIAVAVVLVIPPKEPLGGLDLVGYCRTYQLEQRHDTCAKDLNLTDACNWSYGGEDNLTHQFDPSDRDSARCFRPGHRETVGGISGLPKYCQEIYANKIIGASFDEQARKWVCRFTINRDAACIALYNKPGLEARYDETDGNWNCYE